MLMLQITQQPENYHRTCHLGKRRLSSIVVHIFHGWMITSSTQGMIFKSKNALDKMKFMISLGLVTMNPVEVIFPIEGLYIRYYIWAIHGPQYLKTQRNISRVATVAKEWVIPFRFDKMPLQPQIVLEPFEIWVMDFVGPINPPSKQKTYIFVYTDYVTKCVEAVALLRAIEEAVINFLFELLVQYGLPRELVTDGGSHFTTHKISAMRRFLHDVQLPSYALVMKNATQ